VCIREFSAKLNLHCRNPFSSFSMSTPTKNCLDPWSFLLIKADGNVCLCCWSQPIGNVHTAGLNTIVGGMEAQQLRSSLLTGELLDCCRHCPAREDTTTDKLYRDVETYLSDSDKRTAISQGQLILTPPVAEPSHQSSKPKSSEPRLKYLWKSTVLRPLKILLNR
jgi:hypothetical protein